MTNGLQLGVSAFGEVTLYRQGGKSWAWKKIPKRCCSTGRWREPQSRAAGVGNVVQYFGHVVSHHGTVLVMELLDDLTKTYTNRSLSGQ